MGVHRLGKTQLFLVASAQHGRALLLPWSLLTEYVKGPTVCEEFLKYI